MENLRLLVLSDLHYALEPNAAIPQRKSLLGAELARRAIDDASRRGGFDVLVILGDLLNNGLGARADAELVHVRKTLDDAMRAAGQKPMLIAPGNHDGAPEQLLAAMGTRAGPHRIGGRRFFVFADSYGEDDTCTRPQSQRQAFAQALAEDGGPLVVLQHNPMHPQIESTYPFMLTNRQQVLEDYDRAGVALSLSGHYHAGQPLCERNGVRYYTAAVLCEFPFRYAIVTLSPNGVSVEERPLAMDASLGLMDCHAHTELAYCSSGATAVQAIDRARTFGLSAVCLTEHSPQLYCSQDDFWNGRHVRQPEVWRNGSRERARLLRDVVDPLRGTSDGMRVLAGLEIEMDVEGRPIVDPGDHDWADIIIGAVHFLPTPASELTPDQIMRQFWDSTCAVVRSGVDILAHPLRYLQRKCPVPAWMLTELPDLLAQTNTAAEVNFHNTANDVEFFRQCLRRGVKISLGSDAHQPHEVGNFGAHVALIKEAAGSDDIGELLWRP